MWLYLLKGTHIITYEDSLPKEFMAILENLENRGQKTRNSCNPITQRLPFNILVSVFPFFYAYIHPNKCNDKKKFLKSH